MPKPATSCAQCEVRPSFRDFVDSFPKVTVPLVAATAVVVHTQEADSTRAASAGAASTKAVLAKEALAAAEVTMGADVESKIRIIIFLL